MLEKVDRRTQDWLLRLAGVAVALFLSALVLLALGTSPLEAAVLLFTGALGTPGDLAAVLTAWVPVLLCSAGLLLTYSAGLWNIGIEGQIVMGAVFATGMLRLVQDLLPPPLALVLGALAGIVGGMLWAVLAGLLRLYGNVSEIFGGLGLNFVAGSLVVYLVTGPWSRPGTGTTSGTIPFPPSLWLPAFPGFAVSPIEIALALVALVLVGIALRGTYFGLRLKAIGKNLRSAYLLGVPVNRYLLAAFALCGALAGLAGWILVVGASARHNLFPLISSGYGFLAILVVLLANLNAVWVLPISFFFAAISMGSLELVYEKQLDSAVGSAIQGLLVLSVLFTQGLQRHFLEKRAGREKTRVPAEEEAET